MLTRYPLTVQQIASPEAADLLIYGLHRVTQDGTAKELAARLPGWKR